MEVNCATASPRRRNCRANSGSTWETGSGWVCVTTQRTPEASSCSGETSTSLFLRECGLSGRTDSR